LLGRRRTPKQPVACALGLSNISTSSGGRRMSRASRALRSSPSAPWRPTARSRRALSEPDHFDAEKEENNVSATLAAHDTSAATHHGPGRRAARGGDRQLLRTSG
jgi:hypothetical protein